MLPDALSSSSVESSEDVSAGSSSVDSLTSSDGRWLCHGLNLISIDGHFFCTKTGDITLEKKKSNKSYIGSLHLLIAE